MTAGMLLKSSVVKFMAWEPIQDPSMRIIRAAAIILGIKVKVISCIWVADWKMAIIRPTSKLDSNTGPATLAMVHNICVPICTTNSWFKTKPPC